MGDTAGLWEDDIQQQPFALQFPNLYEYANNKNVSLKDGLAATNLLDIFKLPMSRTTYNEFLVFKDELDSLRVDNDQTNIWVYHWSGGLYTSRKFYRYQFENVMPPPPFYWIWKAKCMPRIEFFTWLLLVDRLNTRDLLRRRHKHMDIIVYYVMTR
jgi:hypothetical protein